MIGSFAGDVLAPLVRGEDLDRETAREGLAMVLSGEVDDARLGAFLAALTAKGETADEMTGFIDAMVAAADTFSVGPDAIDVVGTGGDQLHTVNVSTMAALAVAGCGVRVAKHGNRSATSSVGSADLLEALGVRLDAPAPVVRACVERASIGFCFAPTFHHALARLAPVRRALGFRTVFNVLGPLANPALVERSLVGVAPARLVEPMAQVLAARGMRYAILVSGADGLDELSLAGPTTVATVTPEEVVLSTIDAGAVLGRRHGAESLRGGGVADNVAVVRRFLAGEPGAVFDVVCANAGLALVVAGEAATLDEGFALASASVTEGRAAAALAALVEVSNS